MKYDGLGADFRLNFPKRSCYHSPPERCQISDTQRKALLQELEGLLETATALGSGDELDQIVRRIWLISAEL